MFRISVTLDRCSNNEAEAAGLILALGLAWWLRCDSIASLRIEGDSQLILRLVRGEAEPSDTNSRIARLVRIARRFTACLDRMHLSYLTEVSLGSHVRRAQNREADAAANAGADKSGSAPGSNAGDCSLDPTQAFTAACADGGPLAGLRRRATVFAPFRSRVRPNGTRDTLAEQGSLEPNRIRVEGLLSCARASWLLVKAALHGAATRFRGEGEGIRNPFADDAPRAGRFAGPGGATTDAGKQLAPGQLVGVRVRVIKTGVVGVTTASANGYISV